MAATRKLQGEIERCLKKVSEGVEVFEDIWQKVHNATNANQKEKYEADLKKEIKKLQRLRDQIKSWLASGEVKDKSILLENRRLIETQMERFKVVERETKTKAYSKEGLGAAQKLDPAQRERDEANQWLSQSIESLQIQTDQFETEIESLQVVTKKKKLDKDKQERIDRLKVLLDSHNDHIKKLEMVMRLLDNMSVSVDQVNKIKDDVDYYIECGTEPDYQENLYIYDEINFDELNHNALEVSEVGTGGSGCDQEENDCVSGINTGSTPSVSSSSPVPSLSAVGTGSSSNSHHSMNDELGIHPAINEKKRHRSSESEASSKRMGSTTASSATSNSHGGVNSSPSMSTSGTPPPQQQNNLHHLQQPSLTTLNNGSALSSSTTVPQSPLPTTVPPSPAKVPLATSVTVVGSNSTPNNSSSSSGTTTAPPVNGPLSASVIMNMTNHVDVSMTPPSTPVAALQQQQQRFTMMNGGTSPIVVPSPAVGSVTSLPSSPMVSQPQATPGSAASSLSVAPPTSTSTSGISSNVVRQLFQPSLGAPASSAAPGSSAMDILSQRLAGHASANNRNDVTANANLTGNLIPGLKSPQIDSSVTSSVPGSEVAPLFGLAKEAVLNAQQQHQEALRQQEQQQSTENEKNKGLQMDILASLMDNVRSGQHNQVLSSSLLMNPSSSANSPPMNLSSSMAPGLGTSSTMTTTSSSGQSSVGNNLPVGLHLGGGPDKASIAAFMAENKLNTLPGASSLGSPASSQGLHQHVFPSGVLGSMSGQQPPGIMTSSSSTAPSTSSSSDLMSMSTSRFDASSFSSPSSTSSATLSTSVSSTTMPPSAAQVAAAVSGLGVSGAGMSSSVASATSGEARIPPSVAVNPTGPALLTKENQLQMQLLELATFRHLLQADGERSRLIPRTPYAGIPPYYPQVVPVACDTMDFFSRLSTETLFFIFYYMEGTKAQYLAAKALKKQSWRFHTRFLMWFQRHEEPKTITDEFEQGAYIYFDFEKWSQRKKEGFTFEYRYLEDRDLN